MKKLGVLITIGFLSINAFTQQAVPFKIKYLPSHTYNMAMKMDMGMDMAIQGDSATIAKMEASGMKQPIVMQMSRVSNAAIKTGPLTRGKTFPLTMTSTQESSKATMNGKELPLPKKALTDKVFTGECDIDGKLHLDSLTGGGTNPQVKAAVIEMINKMQGQIKFPEKPLKVGESFTQEIPMNVPISGFNLDMAIKNIYTLTAIKDGLAYFDTVLSMNMDLNTEKNGLTITAKGDGTGTGKFVYSVKNNFALNMTNDMALNLNMNIKEMKMGIKMKMKSDIRNDISAN